MKNFNQGVVVHRAVDIGLLYDDLFYPLQKEFEKFFDGFFCNSVLDGLKSKTGYPKLDVSTENGKFIVRAAVPGVSQENVSVEVLPNGIARISGETSSEYKSDKANYYVRELHKSNFCRELRLPEGVLGDPEAEIKDGILTVSWKYDCPVKVNFKKIEIKKK
jgi:HSP20 family molecular chaperone IbpA